MRCPIALPELAALMYYCVQEPTVKILVSIANSIHDTLLYHFRLYKKHIFYDQILRVTGC